ncbi:MAG: hypothetical protein AAGP08_14525, partial [Pseudomonadota bacterium]
MHRILLTTALLFPVAAFAAGGGDSTPPKPTSTTLQCTDGKVASVDGKSCVAPQSGSLDDDTLYRAVREFAYAGQYIHAQEALAAMSDQTDDRVLTYMGFTHRKMGDTALGNAYYRQAIAANPDNLLARSYMGQGFVAEGDLVAAYEQ